MPKGSPHAHFQRSIERGNLLSAETAARDLPQPLSLANALALCLLMAEQDPSGSSERPHAGTPGSCWTRKPSPSPSHSFFSRRWPASPVPSATWPRG